MLGRLRLRAMPGQSRGGADASPQGDLNGSRRKFVRSSALDLNNQEVGDQYSAQAKRGRSTPSWQIYLVLWSMVLLGCCRVVVVDSIV